MTSTNITYRTQSLYSFSEAARLAGVSTSTVRNWLFGYTAKERKAKPLFNAPPDTAMVSFFQMIEITVAARFRKVGHVKYPVVQQAYENTKAYYKLDFPFAHLKLESMGGHIVQHLRNDTGTGSHQSVNQPQQWTLPNVVQDVVDQLDYEEELAARWFPVGRDVPIVVDPQISSGVPTFLGRGVTIAVIHKRWKAGQPISYIAEDFELDPVLVEKILRYAEQIAA